MESLACMEKIILMYVNVMISPVVICNYCFFNVLIKGFVLLNVTTTSFFSVASLHTIAPRIVALQNTMKCDEMAITLHLSE